MPLCSCPQAHCRTTYMRKASWESSSNVHDHCLVQNNRKPLRTCPQAHRCPWVKKWDNRLVLSRAPSCPIALEVDNWSTLKDNALLSLQCRSILWESNLSRIAWIHLIRLALGKNSRIFPISGISVGCSVSVGTSLQIVPSMSHTAAGIVEPNRLLVPGSQCAILWELFWIVPLFRFVGNNGIYVCSNIVSKFVLKTFGFRRGRTVGSLKKITMPGILKSCVTVGTSSSDAQYNCLASWYNTSYFLLRRSTIQVIQTFCSSTCACKDRWIAVLVFSTSAIENLK